MISQMHPTLNDPDVFDEDQSDLAFLRSTPTCFAVFGPPGSGKSLVARLLSQIWKCLLLNPSEIITESLKRPGSSLPLKEALHSQDGVPEDVVLHHVKQKLNSKEVFNYGYVLDGFPSPEVTSMDLNKQFECLRSLELKINFVIMIRFPLEDAVRRRETMYYHSPTGLLVPSRYISETSEYLEVAETKPLEMDDDEAKLVVVAPAEKKVDIIEESTDASSENEDESKAAGRKRGSKSKVDQKDTSDEEGEEQSSQEGEESVSEEGKDDVDSNTSSLNFKQTTFGHIKRRKTTSESAEPVDTSIDQDKEIGLFHQLFFPNLPLVKGRIQFPRETLHLRIEDSVDWIQDNYLDFKRSFLPHIELLLNRLDCMRIQKPAIPRPMQDFSENKTAAEETNESLEEQLKQALVTGAISARWKWRRSTWGTFCPVSMFEGQLLNGSVAFATCFLDRVYFLADKLSQDKFLENPRLYILPPNPRVPTRFLVCGPPKSGRTQLANALSSKYNIRIVDVSTAAVQVNDEQKQAFMTAADATATRQAIELVRRSTADALKTAKTLLITLANDARALRARSPLLDEVEALLNEDTAAYLSEVASMSSPNSPHTPPPDPADIQGPALTQAGAATGELMADDQAKLIELETRLESSMQAFRELQANTPMIDSNNPDVISEKEKIMNGVSTDGIQFDNKRYVGLVKEQIDKTGAEIDNNAANKYLWILDNVIQNSAVIALMLELGSKDRPTDCIVLRDKSERYGTLREWTSQANKENNSDSTMTDDLWNQNIGVISQVYTDIGSIESELTKVDARIHNVDITGKSSVVMAEEVDKTLRGTFKNPIVEYEEVEEEEDDEAEEEEDLENEGDGTMFNQAEENSEKLKPVGETSEYCPVALKEMKTLWPGDPQHGGVIYKDKIYHFSSTEAKEKFSLDPDAFLPVDRPFQVPPLKIFVVGPTGSGRTTHSKYIAEMTNAITINLQNVMTEIATPKLQKPPVELFRVEKDPPFWKQMKMPLPNASELKILDKQLPAGISPVKLPFLSSDPENPVPPDAVEQACLDALSGESPLATEILETFLDRWQKAAPFAGRNLVFDGFPMYPDDIRFLLERGVLPDAVIFLNVETDLIADRIIPTRKNHWLQEKRKREEQRQKNYFNKHLDWVKQRKTRKAELLAEHEQAKKQKQQERDEQKKSAANEEDGDEQTDDNEEDDDKDKQIEQVLSDELPEPMIEDEQGEDESEPEDEASDRLDDELREKIEQEHENLEAIKEILEEHQMTVIEANTKRPFFLASKKVKDKLDILLKRRDHAFEKSYPVTSAMAKEMVDVHYKRLGKFGTWCPVKILNGHLFPPSSKLLQDSFPVIYRQYIYFCSTSAARQDFMLKPEYFVRQPAPRLCLPIRIAVLGPPKSGKTTLSVRLARELGVTRISTGEAIRFVLQTLAESELGRILKVYVSSGTEIPDNLEVLCLEAYLRTSDCQARGWILDGHPTTINKLNLMLQRFIVPTIIFELSASNKLCVYRSLVDALMAQKVMLPLFNNAQVVATRLAHYRKNFPAIKSYLQYAMKNIVEIDASESKWKGWFTAMQVVAARTTLIQDYVERREAGRATPLTHLCVTPNQMLSRLSTEYQQFCPVTLNMEGALFDCIERATFQFIAEYKDRYYLFATKEKLDMFLSDPDTWLPPNVRFTVPPADQRAKATTLSDLDDKWGERLGFHGLCPVTYKNFNFTSEGLKYGSLQWMAEYQNKIYLFADEELRRWFISAPERYISVPEPAKLPPRAEHSEEQVEKLSAIPFLECEIGPHLVRAMVELTTLLPKFPLVGFRESALTFIAFYLKAVNNKAESAVRDLNRDKLESFASVLKLADQLVVNAQASNKGVAYRNEVLSMLHVRDQMQKNWLRTNPF